MHLPQLEEFALVLGVLAVVSRAPQRLHVGQQLRVAPDQRHALAERFAEPEPSPKSKQFRPVTSLFRLYTDRHRVNTDWSLKSNSRTERKEGRFDDRFESPVFFFQSGRMERLPWGSSGPYGWWTSGRMPLIWFTARTALSTIVCAPTVPKRFSAAARSRNCTNRLIWSLLDPSSDRSAAKKT